MLTLCDKLIIADFISFPFVLLDVHRYNYSKVQLIKIITLVNSNYTPQAL